MCSQIELPLIVGIVGKIRSGKSTVAEYISKMYGYEHCPNVRVLKSLAETMGLQPTRSNLSRIGGALFEDLGRDVIARARVAQVNARAENSDLRIVVDGIRYPEELVVYREIRNFCLISVDCNDENRFIRATASRNVVKDGTISAKDFGSLDCDDSERYVSEMMRQSDIHVPNFGSLTELEQEIIVNFSKYKEV